MILGLGGMLAACWGISDSSAADRFSKVYVFGDSLSDTGNAMSGRYSNGPVWVEHVAERFDAAAAPARTGGTNFAFGGARTHGPAGSHSLRVQADRFLGSLPSGRAEQDALYIVYGGGNDLRAAIDARDPGAVVDGAVGAIRGIIRDLATAGAVHFLVPNLPDLGRTPEIRWRGADAVKDAAALTVAFNDALARTLSELEATHPIRTHRLDVFGLLEQVAAHPEMAGFTNITEPCLSGAGACRNPEHYLFWDSIHPTAAGHARLAEAALQVLSADTGGKRRSTL